MNVGTVLDLIILAAIGVAGLVWKSLSSGVEEGFRTQSKEIVAEFNRAAVLDRTLETTRGTERQELRFASYGALWSKMRPLAIYDDSPLNRDSMHALSRQLSDWYFSDVGGLLLTTPLRNLYFAFQDLITATSTGEYWEVARGEDPKTAFENVLEEKGLDDALKLMAHLEVVATTHEWPAPELEALTKEWRADIRQLAKGWQGFDEERFAILQQVSSVLRTGLTNDVESRLR